MFLFSKIPIPRYCKVVLKSGLCLEDGTSVARHLEVIPAVPANPSASGVPQTKKDLVISESDPDSGFDFQ